MAKQHKFSRCLKVPACWRLAPFQSCTPPLKLQLGQHVRHRSSFTGQHAFLSESYPVQNMLGRTALVPLSLLLLLLLLSACRLWRCGALLA
eukprot:1136435-Pelagomonas_calceolata.AAC.3